MFKQIDHIAIAVDNLDEAVRLYEDHFRARVSHREFIAHDDVEIAVVTVGGTSIELVEGKSENSPIRKYVVKRGQGIHHIAFEVDDIESVLAALRAASIELIDDKPRPGKEGSLVAFIHPKSTLKVLYELVQKKNSSD
jgi:methylmalonyl-CoA/ethylmalonyl-CoA epimerase